MNMFIRSSRDPQKNGKWPPRKSRPQVENHCFRGFDWLSNIFDSKIMAKKCKLIREITTNPLGNMQIIWVFWP